MKRLFAALAVLLLAGAPARAQAPTEGASELPVGVAEEQITVSSDYRGSFITVFGYNPDRRGRGDIVVVLRGPPQAAVVMRKRRVFGLWINGDPVRFSEAPSFFAGTLTRLGAGPRIRYLFRLFIPSSPSFVVLTDHHGFVSGTEEAL